ncbi:MAG: hypothetical protein KJ955_07750 [Nanoarchaeota archaeon]|nr:hypothetical protein [Nanoarchaeota archaeon]
MNIDNVYPKCKGKPIVPTKEAATEIMQCGLDMDDIAEILEKGFDCSTSRRKKGTFEQGLRKGSKLIKAVAVEKECMFLLIHVGKISFPKGLTKHKEGEKCWTKNR